MSQAPVTPKWLGGQRESRRTSGSDDQAAKIQQVEFDRLAANLISSASNHINEEDLLQADRSNFAAWEDFIKERMRGSTGVVLFFNRPAQNLLHERVGQALLVSSIHQSLRRGVSRHATAHAMFFDLHARFHSVSQAAVELLLGGIELERDECFIGLPL
ncbi:uncharacterized protein PGTG_19397 [Puccinia graminis f. sp. tritici CRL 75-36-700-3]|uniref:Uncharacterized protein n=1 Tax=Puccinia graminis f. sp. tritici (strain CRL 75-36-700-3 / race SCCL) TaxID=418459 RepID=E3LA04_PUCGT|nr:uncharacterized protein PGTG_19397 [Puccinia graminis f. sp. tritici CRL 75-36-700-3]EFP93379.1 hypothetical protein PGTG_19397 [Puccinia graminis f. sp. tritici CRL 75-36-700-3]